MKFDSKKRRAFWRRTWKKFKPYFNWIIIAAPVMFTALVKFQPQLWVLFSVAAGATQFGKEVWKERKDIRRVQNPEFFGDYIELLSKSLSVMQDVNAYSVETVQFMEQATLKTVCDMVALYYGELKKPEARNKFNASIMVPRPYEEWIETRDGKQHWKESVKFFDDNRNVEACSHILELTDWAKIPDNWKEFALPVETDEDYLLPGAPRAFAKDEMQVCSDTLAADAWESELTKHSSKAQQGLRNYFEDQKNELRSFFSIPLHADTKIVGVLNVQSSEINILGVDAEHREDLEMCLRPFCSLLAALLVREEAA